MRSLSGDQLGRIESRLVRRDLALVRAVPVHQPDFPETAAVRRERDLREEHARPPVHRAHELIRQHVRRARERRFRRAIALLQLRGSSLIEEPGLDDVVLAFEPDVELQVELRFDSFEKIGRDGHRRRQRRDSEDAGVGDVARERAEKALPHFVRRNCDRCGTAGRLELRKRHRDADDLRRLIGRHRGGDVRLRECADRNQRSENHGSRQLPTANCQLHRSSLHRKVRCTPKYVPEYAKGRGLSGFELRTALSAARSNVPLPLEVSTFASLIVPSR